MRDKWKGILQLITGMICLFFAANMMGCQSTKTKKQNSKDRIENNRMNFPDLQKTTLGGISFQLSGVFEKKDVREMTLSQVAGVYFLEELQCYLIVECFSDEEVLTYFGQQPNPENQPLYVLSGYANRSSNNSPMNSSVVKPVRIGKKGSGWTFSYSQVNTKGEETRSLLAAAKVGNKLCVVKLTGASNIIPYFYDDFLVFLKSIEA